MNGVRINGWRLHPRENRLRRRGKVVELQPRCMQLLIYLVQRPRVVVSRAELLDEVWRGRVVGEDALNNCVRKLRRALDDDPRNPSVIETITGQGYRLKARVRQPVIGGRRWRPAWIASGLGVAALIALITSHDHVAVYRFDSADSPEQRDAKIARMVDELGTGQGARRAVAIRLHGNSEVEASDQAGG